MRLLARSLGGSFLAVMAACGGPDTNDKVGPKDLRFDVPAAPAAGAGFQVIGPDIVVAKGTDKMICWVPDIDITEDHMMKGFTQFQAEYGHHLFGMRSVIPRQPGETFDCTNTEDMSTVEPLITPSAGGGQEGGSLLPPEFAVRIPAGTQLVMQSHYVNYSDEDILVRDVGNFEYLAPGEEKIEANFLVLNDGEFSVPPTNELYAHSAECTVTERFQFASLNGHMHEWGKHTWIEKETPEGDVTLIYDEPQWTAAMRDAPEFVRFPIDDPLVFEPGDTIRVGCEWVNDTNEALEFPNEMCVALFVYFPALPEGFIVCD